MQRVGWPLAWWVLAVLGFTGASAQPASAPPNILFAIADDWSHPHAGAYGARWVNTPAFDRVAREGLLFTRGYTPNSKCAPSRSCVLTGRNSWQLEAAANHWCYFPEKFRTFPEVLTAAGWHVGFTGKGWGPGVARAGDGRQRNLTGAPFNQRTAAPPTLASGRNDYAANFDAFLDARPAGKPFCFWYGAVEPHRAYEAGTGSRLGGKKPEEVDRVPGFWPDGPTIRRDMLDYAYEVEHFDRHLNRMLQSLERRGELQNTLVVVTSDNAMPFPRMKGDCYEPALRMPLAMMWPAGIARPGRQVDSLVSFIDFAPTLLQLAGVDPSTGGMEAIQGRSLVPFLRGKKPSGDWDHVLVGRERHDIGRPDDVGYPTRGIVTAEHLYLRNYDPSRWPACNPETGYLNCDGSPTKTEIIQARKTPDTRRYWSLAFGRRPPEELYDLRRDPDCLKNLATDAGHAGRMRSLRERMERRLKQEGDPRASGKGDVFDRFPIADEANRHFYARYMRGEQLRPGWVNPSDFDPEAAGEP